MKSIEDCLASMSILRPLESWTYVKAEGGKFASESTQVTTEK